MPEITSKPKVLSYEDFLKNRYLRLITEPQIEDFGGYYYQEESDVIAYVQKHQSIEIPNELIEKIKPLTEFQAQYVLYVDNEVKEQRLKPSPNSTLNTYN